MGKSAGKAINIDLAKYLHAEDKEFVFPLKVKAAPECVATVHVCSHHKRGLPGVL